MSTLSGLGSLSSLNALGSNAPTVNGLASGLNTDQIIQALLALNQQQIKILQTQESGITQQQAAFQTIQAKLSTLQGLETALGSSQNSVFANLAVASSNTNLVTAVASSSAVPGIYSLKVNGLAQAHQIASQGFDSANSAITQGTLQIGTASGTTATITIDSTNNTLQGLANAINSAGIGVNASIVNDGSSTQAYRLLLASTKTGTANAITLTNNLAADNAGARQPVLGATYIGQVALGTGYTGTSTPTANSGAGTYTGASNNTYTFTVVNGGTVGTDNGIQLSFTDNTGANTGTITLNNTDANVFKTVAQGLQVQFAAGTVVAGQAFSVKTYVPTVQQATNASVTVGSGSGALTVQSATNQLTGLIKGLTVNLVGADPTQNITLTVSSDTSKASQAVQDFVSAYNDLQSFINQQESYNSQTQQAGLLLGNGSASDIQDLIHGSLTNIVGNVNPQLNLLSGLGITDNADGTLSLDQTKLNAVLGGQVPGVTIADVQRLFGLSGTSTNPGIQFITGSAKTQASSTPYQVVLTQAATQGSITATNPLAASTVINGTNNSFTIAVDGKQSSTITLAQGTYTPQALVQQLQSAISTAFTGQTVAVGLAGNQLVITSGSYGLASSVAIGAGTALAALGFAGTESGKGQDVVGNFVVNGVTEAAVGLGQVLTGQAGNANTAGLEVRVTLSPSQIPQGPAASLTVTRGVASRLDVALNGLLDPVTGRLKSINDSYQQNIDSINAAIAEQNQIMQAKQQSLLQQFVALETTISQLKTTGSLLSTQLLTLNQTSTTGTSSSIL